MLILNDDYDSIYKLEEQLEIQSLFVNQQMWFLTNTYKYVEILQINSAVKVYTTFLKPQSLRYILTTSTYINYEQKRTNNVCGCKYDNFHVGSKGFIK